MKTIIHVNRHIIDSNRKKGENKPPITVKNYKNNIKAYEVIIDGPSTVVFNPEKPLACGAKVWIETNSSVTCIKRKSKKKLPVKSCKNSSLCK